MALKELGGWESIEMVQKYAHLNADHLLGFANHVKFLSNTSIMTANLVAENEPLDETTGKKKAVSS